MVKSFFGGLSPQKSPVATGLNFGPPVLLGGEFTDICLKRIIAYSV